MASECEDFRQLLVDFLVDPGVLGQRLLDENNLPEVNPLGSADRENLFIDEHLVDDNGLVRSTILHLVAASPEEVLEAFILAYDWRDGVRSRHDILSENETALFVAMATVAEALLQLSDVHPYVVLMNGPAVAEKFTEISRQFRASINSSDTLEPGEDDRLDAAVYGLLLVVEGAIVEAKQCALALLGEAYKAGTQNPDEIIKVEVAVTVSAASDKPETKRLVSLVRDDLSEVLNARISELGGKEVSP